MVPPYDDECTRTMRADIINLAEYALAMARESSAIFDVSTHTATVREWMECLGRSLTDIDTTEQELHDLEQRGYESTARMHLTLARKETSPAVIRKNITAFRLYAQISERSFLFFGINEEELTTLVQ